MSVQSGWSSVPDGASRTGPPVMPPPVGDPVVASGAVVVHLLDTYMWGALGGYSVWVDGRPMKTIAVTQTWVVPAGRRRVVVRANYGLFPARKWVDVRPNETVEVYFVPNIADLMPGNLYLSPRKFWGLTNIARSTLTFLLMFAAFFATLALGAGLLVAALEVLQNVFGISG